MMTTVQLPPETIERLTQRAAMLRATVGEVIDQLSREIDVPGKSPLTTDYFVTESNAEWLQNFQKLLRLAKSHEGKYAPGFEADVRRESMNCEME
ncbi:MAG: hypothetical protein U0798_01960 [Gemmataceae bacterium]